MSREYRHAKHEAQGDRRGRASQTSEPFRPKITAPEAQLALLRATWAQRDLLGERERGYVWSFLRQAEHKPLSDAQLETAKSIGLRIGVGYDDPAFDDPEDAPPSHTDLRPFGGSRALRPQPWGPLPARPPGAKS